MKPHSQPFREAGTQPLFGTLTITRPWDRLWESMPQPLAFLPCLPSPAAGGSVNCRRLWEMDKVCGGVPLFPSCNPVAGPPSFSGSPQPSPPALSHLVLLSRGPARKELTNSARSHSVYTCTSRDRGTRQGFVPRCCFLTPGRVRQGRDSLQDWPLDGWLPPLLLP